MEQLVKTLVIMAFISMLYNVSILSILSVQHSFGKNLSSKIPGYDFPAVYCVNSVNFVYLP